MANRTLDTSTRLAVERTRLANERTLMAWIRTSTSLIAVLGVMALVVVVLKL